MPRFSIRIWGDFTETERLVRIFTVIAVAVMLAATLASGIITAASQSAENLFDLQIVNTV